MARESFIGGYEQIGTMVKGEIHYSERSIKYDVQFL